MSHPLTVKPASARSGMSRCKKQRKGREKIPVLPLFSVYGTTA